MESAEAVCDNEGDLGTAVLDGLASLLNTSLVRRQGEDDAKPRLLLLETLREFASEQLHANREAEAIAARHAAHFLALAERPGQSCGGRSRNDGSKRSTLNTTTYEPRSPTRLLSLIRRRPPGWPALSAPTGRVVAESSRHTAGWTAPWRPVQRRR
jgi:hypothetical protein